MRNARKLILGILSLAILLGATPASAQLLGAWAGTGDGYCYPHSGVVIYPWNVWEGKVYISEEEDATIFEGTWEDELGNYGTFIGKVLPISPSEDQKICLGEWTWYDPDGISSEPVYGGDFKMTFYIKKGYCEGRWTTIWPTPYKVGTMKGEKID